jgi:hypothetical protein
MTRMPDRSRIRLATLSILGLLAMGGCGAGPEIGYGRSSGKSLNGTGVFSGMVRRSGHEVRVARRLTDELLDWADAIVRFAPRPGPPGHEEANWYMEWMKLTSDARLVYVVRDYDAEPEYWRLVLQDLDPGSEADRARREEAEESLERAEKRAAQRPEKEESPADPDEWFTTGSADESPRPSGKLTGPWAEGVEASIPVHEPLKSGDRDVLLLADDRAVVMQQSPDGDSWLLVVANGSFLLNLPLAMPERRPLAAHVVEWLGPQPRHVAFVEGSSVLGGPDTPPSLFDLLGRIASFRWVAVQFAVFGFLACLARAPRLGRPRPEPGEEVTRPVAHAEALGGLLRKARGITVARGLIDSYRRWRFARVSQEATHPQGPTPG